MPKAGCYAADVALLLRCNERDAAACSACAPRPADTVNVPLVVLRWIEVDDVRDVDEVEAARRDVGRHERLDLPERKRSSARSRADCVMSPCSAMAATS